RLIDNLQQATGRTLDTMRTGKDQADRGVAHVIEADEALDRIREAMSRASAIGEQIARAAEEQRAVAEGNNRNLSNIAQLADHTATQARQNARLSDELAGTARSQSALVARFRI